MSDQRGVPPDVEAKLFQLERLVGEAKTVPLSSSVMLNRAEIDGLVADLREALPDELTQARWVIKERDDILERAQIDADDILEQARTEQERLVSEQEVVHTAQADAQRIVTEAREHARRIRLEAEDYVDAKLANFEVVLQKTLGAVERGRAKLRGGLDTDALGDVGNGSGAEPDDERVDDSALGGTGIDVPLDDDPFEVAPER